MIDLLQSRNLEISIVAIVVGILNLYFLISATIKQNKILEMNKSMAAKIVAGLNKEDDLKKGPSVFNINAFIDGGVLIALAVTSIVAIIYSQETVPKKTVTAQKKFKIESSVYQCKELQRLEYYDLQLEQTRPIVVKKPVKKPVKKECQ